MKAGLALYARLLGYARPYKRVVALSLVAMAVAAALEPVLPALLRPLVDESLIAKDPTSLWRVPLLILVAFVFKGLAEYLATVSSQWVAQRAIADLRGELFAHQLDLPMSHFGAESTGRMISRVTYDAEQVGAALSSAWIIVIRDSMILVGLSAFLLYTAWELTLMMLVIAPVIALAIRQASRLMRTGSRDVQARMGELTARLDEALTGIREVKIYAAGARERRRFVELVERLRRDAMRVVRAQAANVPLVQMLAAAAVAGVIYAAGLLSADDRLTPGGFVAFIAAMAMLFEPIRRLTNVNAVIQRGLAGAQSLFGLLDTPTEHVAQAASASATAPERAVGRLVLQGVRYRHPGQDGWALDGIDLEIAPGRRVAVVGPSGGGKSSLLHLLAGFDVPTEGAVLLDGHSLGQWGLEAWRAQIALVSQNIVLFDDTVRANIALGRDEASEAQVIAAAKAAHAWSFIEALPKGLETPLGAKGMALSGGQRQRLALARAFLKDAPVLLLDEATSALDAESERAVRQALRE
ncbi:MAG: ATP-binding cassette domain-containing protein, partial [Burkholderiales bacterium]